MTKAITTMPVLRSHSKFGAIRAALAGHHAAAEGAALDDLPAAWHRREAALVAKLSATPAVSLADITAEAELLRQRQADWGADDPDGQRDVVLIASIAADLRRLAQ